MWQYVCTKVSDDCSMIKMYMLKRLYKYCWGACLNRCKLFTQNEEQNLLWRLPLRFDGKASTNIRPMVTKLRSSAVQMREQVKEAPVTPLRWKGNHAVFMVKCVFVARKWSTEVLSSDRIRGTLRSSSAEIKSPSTWRWARLLSTMMGLWTWRGQITCTTARAWRSGSQIWVMRAFWLSVANVWWIVLLTLCFGHTGSSMQWDRGLL